MKKITLYGPNVRNDRSFADAGTTLTIGDGPTEIASDRAKAAVKLGTAVSETAAKADANATEHETETVTETTAGTATD